MSVSGVQTVVYSIVVIAASSTPQAVLLMLFGDKYGIVRSQYRRDRTRLEYATTRVLHCCSTTHKVYDTRIRDQAQRGTTMPPASSRANSSSNTQHYSVTAAVHWYIGTGVRI